MSRDMFSMPDDDFDQDDGLDDDGNFPFDCPRFWVSGKGGGWYCPLAGTEECDWECEN